MPFEELIDVGIIASPQLLAEIIPLLLFPDESYGEDEAFGENLQSFMRQEDPDVGHGNLHHDSLGVTGKIVNLLPFVDSPFAFVFLVKISRFKI